MFAAVVRARAARDRGFTLIELLVVIVVVGILAAIAIPVFLNQRDKAALGTTRANARAVIPDIVLARENRGGSLRLVTGSAWSYGQCNSAPVLRVDDPGFAGSSCGIRWLAMTQGIADDANTTVASVRRLLTDGWGRPMILDENEGEGGNCVIIDALYSTGGADTFGTGKQARWLLPQGGFC